MIGEMETTYGNIPFPYGGVGHMDVIGEIPIGPARLFGVIEMPPVIGNIATVPALGDMYGG